MKAMPTQPRIAGFNYGTLVALCLAMLAFAIRAEEPATPPKPTAPTTTTTIPATPPTPSDTKSDDAAKKAFGIDYDAALAAVNEKNWPLVKQKTTSALKALGEVSDVRKTTAQILFNKADRMLVKDDAMFTAAELMKLKQWVEAEEVFRKIVDVSGETESLRQSVMTCRAGMEAEHPELKKAGDLLKEKKWKEAIEAFNKASDTVGGIRMIRDGIQQAQLGIEADDLFRKAPAYLKTKRWDDAFNAYKRLSQIVGNTDEIQKGINAAQNGYAEEHKGAADLPKQ